MKRDIVIMLFIIMLPFLFYLYTIVPTNTKSWEILLFTFNSGDFETIDLFFWSLSIKMLTIGVLSLWFISCIHKWKFVLIIPIIIEIYKLLVNINFAINGNQNVDLIKLVIISVSYIYILILICQKLKFVSSKKINDLVNEEINVQLINISEFDSKEYKSFESEFKMILASKESLNKKEYLLKLIALRDKIAM